MKEYDQLNTVTDNANEHCWNTGMYSSNCDCALCEHQYECSGSDNDEEEE